MASPPNLSLSGCVAIISGVGDGLGKQTALAMARQGAAALVLCSRTGDRLERIANEVRGTGVAVSVDTQTGDITDADYCARVAESTVTAFGRVDCLVNNAARGPFVPDSFAAVVDADLGAWRQTFEVNVFGSLAMTQAAAR